MTALSRPDDALPAAAGRGDDPLLSHLNEAQARAASHGDGPLLIVAGAGTGKTTTLAHRVAYLLREGAAAERMLLLTFTRRAAASMLDRVRSLLAAGGEADRAKRVWSGTFHGVAARLLRMYGKAVELDRGFGILDQGDAEDLMNLARDGLGVARKDKRFPKKRTCLAVYSRTVNAQRPLAEVIENTFPWVDDYADDLKRLCADYVKRKRDQAVLDYDDLLLFWRALMQSDAGESVRRRFDHVLVDEYQDTNLLQADILRGLRPDGAGLTVVGDDAQSIYSFRAATVRNILDFPSHFPGTTVVPLERNYRSTQAILDLSNAVIEAAKERHEKTLYTDREGGPAPRLMACFNESEEADWVVEQILARTEDGIDLSRQAVLFRASHHAITLEGALNRANIPYVKFGGVKFNEAAHVKDAVSFLRLAENPGDRIAGSRLFALLPGVGPATARKLLDTLEAGDGQMTALQSAKPPKGAATHWPLLVALLRKLQSEKELRVADQIALVRRFYDPIMKEQYDNPPQRAADLDQLEGLAARYRSRAEFLSDLALEPPQTGDLNKPDEVDDLLTLSTVHSAKGLEWDAVHVIHAADGYFPSDKAVGSDAEIEEERRLMYVALTRAKTYLDLTFPRSSIRSSWQNSFGAFAEPSRFLTDEAEGYLAIEEGNTAEEIKPGVWDNLLGQWE